MDNKKYYTIFNYKMAKYLLRNGCTIADIGLNKKMKGIVFHFVNDEKLQKLIALKKDIIKLQKETREISQCTNSATLIKIAPEKQVENTKEIQINNLAENSTKPVIEE